MANSNISVIHVHPRRIDILFVVLLWLSVATSLCFLIETEPVYWRLHFCFEKHLHPLFLTRDSPQEEAETTNWILAAIGLTITMSFHASIPRTTPTGLVALLATLPISRMSRFILILGPAWMLSVFVSWAIVTVGVYVLDRRYGEIPISLCLTLPTLPFVILVSLFVKCRCFRSPSKFRHAVSLGCLVYLLGVTNFLGCIAAPCLVGLLYVTAKSVLRHLEESGA